MTRPIFEPSTQRVLTAQGYGQAQLFRRPAPTGASACLPWIRIGQYSRSVSDSTWTTVPWRFLNYDPACVEENVDYSWTEQSVGLSHNIWQIASRKEGFYLYDCQISWDITGTANTNDAGGVALRMTDGFNELDELYIGADWFDDSAFTSGYEGEIEQGNGVLRLMGVIYIASTNRVWKPQVIQTTGVTKTVEGTYFLLTRLQETVGADWTTLTTA